MLPPNAPLPIPTVTSTSPDVTSTPGATASVSIQTPGFYRIAYGVTAENPIGSLSTALVVAGATTLLLPQTAPFGSYRQTVADETTLYLQPGDTVRVQFATPNGLFAVTVDAAFFRVDRIA